MGRSYGFDFFVSGGRTTGIMYRSTDEVRAESIVLF